MGYTWISSNRHFIYAGQKYLHERLDSDGNHLPSLDPTLTPPVVNSPAPSARKSIEFGAQNQRCASTLNNKIANVVVDDTFALDQIPFGCRFGFWFYFNNKTQGNAQAITFLRLGSFNVNNHLSFDLIVDGTSNNHKLGLFKSTFSNPLWTINDYHALSTVTLSPQVEYYIECEHLVFSASDSINRIWVNKSLYLEDIDPQKYIDFILPSCFEGHRSHEVGTQKETSYPDKFYVGEAYLLKFDDENFPNVFRGIDADVFFPVGDGNNLNSTLGGDIPALERYESVNEITPNDKLDYNQINTVGQFDTLQFDFSSLPDNITIETINFNFRLAIHSASAFSGEISVRPVMDVNGTIYALSPIANVIKYPSTWDGSSLGWDNINICVSINPHTGEPFIGADLKDSNTHFGYEFEAEDDDFNTRSFIISQFVIEVLWGSLEGFTIDLQLGDVVASSDDEEEETFFASIGFIDGLS